MKPEEAIELKLEIPEIEIKAFKICMSEVQHKHFMKLQSEGKLPMSFVPYKYLGGQEILILKNEEV